ncbi:unnamed protein product [Auanema sp. JU1783]|nr:unnamed protein product [Auanema sp. JU1783]
MVLAPVVSKREEDSMNNEPSLSGKSIIGLIFPPPDIRAVVDKTASFVARNGVAFENRICEKEANSAKFSFLSPTDPYHAYYRLKIRDCQEGKVETYVPKPIVPDAVKEAIKKAEFVPTKPPPAFEFSADPATINAFDLDLIRTTAIFVAKNGRQFLTQVMTREARNYQFDFLKPAHSNFSYFTKLVEQYTKVIIPPNNILDTLSTEKSSNKRLMEDIKYRVAWEKHQKTLKDKEEKEAEKERLAYAAIDWHDFVVVQTVDFQPGDNANLPALCTPSDVGARILLEQRQEMNKTAGEAVEMDMEESDSDDDEHKSDSHQPEVMRPTPTEFAAPLPPSKQKDIIVRDYDPKTMHKQKRAGEKYLISPLTGERVPTDKLEEHVRYNTVDSQYLEGRDRFASDRASDEPVLAPGADISRNLGNFAERRSDIFGVGAAGAEQTVIGRKLGEEEQAPINTKHIWDGSEETREMHTQRVQNQVTLDQQIHEIQRQHGYIPDPSKERIGAQPIPKPPPPSASAIPIPQRAPVPRPQASIPAPTHAPPPMNDGPPAKRQKTEEDLEPESSWLEKVSGNVDLRIQLPKAPDLGFDGNIIALQIDITNSIGELKQRIQELTNMPIAKQKLNFDGFFLKDQSSLAFYNLNNHSLVTVQVKERGGKNK